LSGVLPSVWGMGEAGPQPVPEPEPVPEPVPESVAGVATGPGLCALLAPLEPGAVDDEQLFELLGAQVRQLAYQQAQVWQVMAELGRRDPMANVPGAPAWTPEQIFDSAVHEVRAELLLTRRGARREMERADTVCAEPRIFADLLAGRIDRARAIVLADGSWDLTEEQTSVLLDELLPKAGRWTVSELADKLARIAIALDPAWAERRYRHAIRERRVVGYLNPDGSATVAGQNLPADGAAYACARVDALADAAKRAGAAAKLDHLRADVFLALLDGTFHGRTEQAITAELVRRYPKLADQPAEAEQRLEPDPADAAAGGAAASDCAETPDDILGEDAVDLAAAALNVLLGFDEEPSDRSVSEQTAEAIRRGWRRAL
jgi:hypothetical protein